MCIGGGPVGPQKYSGGGSRSDGHSASDDMSQDSRDFHDKQAAEARANAGQPTRKDVPRMRGGSAPRANLLTRTVDKYFPKG